MPNIQPFQGLLYNKSKVSLSDVVAPPYDVISSEQQQELYDKSEYNVVRLILGREENRYEESAAYFNLWKKENVILQDDAPAFYVVTQTLMLEDGKQITRKGFIGACELEEFGKSIYPHEKTLSKPKEDRLKLFTATGAMFSQVFSLYTDREYKLNDIVYQITSSKPWAEIEFENVLNRIWKLTDTERINALQQFLSKQKIIIADGHHRYETAMTYRETLRKANPSYTGTEPYNFIPMFFTNTNDPGLMIFPTHRIIHSLPEFDTGALIEKLEEYFRVTIYSNQNQLLKNLPLRTNNFGFILPTALGFILLELKSLSVMEQFGLPEVVAKLDVSVLHTLILNHIFGISEEAQVQKTNLDYVKDSQQAIDLVRAGNAQAGFLLNPTPIEQVREAAEAGYVLPQKSTYFFPKLLSGLVMYSFTSV
ncbi:MAG: DUF1015 domain-containing protein [Bacteroidetes bacterium]|nr:MAG: DUF1015 domain-containing protein [Bacteroidota bacterium]